MQRNYDRSAEDIGNIVGLEHVNVRVPDQRLATLFYITGLGLTRDPYLVTGVVNMWINVGRSQFHLPVGEAQVLRGTTGLVIPDRTALLERLALVQEPLEGTKFSFRARDHHVDVTCPWGNRFRCHTPNTRLGRITLGMPYVELDAPAGSADGIVRFYRQILEADAVVLEEGNSRVARVSVGHHQSLLFRETDAPQPDYDGHHVQVYVTNFSRPHARLVEHGLLTEESNQHQYRFENIVDPANGDVLFALEHEVRSMTHPMFGRPLVNRNPAQTNNAYAAGHESLPWAMEFGA